MSNTFNNGNLGEPALPSVHQLVAVPFGAKDVSVEVKNYSTTIYKLSDYGIKTIAPQQLSVRKDQKEVPFQYQAEAYAKRGFAERPLAEIELQGTMRGIQVGSLVHYEDGTVILSKGPQGGNFNVSCGFDETFNPVEDLTVTVNEDNVTLSWMAPADAYRYRIARNGITLGETSATNYTDQIQEEMTYTYSVTAIYSGGESMPENLLVEFEWAVNETENHFSIYPNPAHDVIYINGGNAAFDYFIYNNIGQQVVNGTAKGSQRIDVSGLTKGLYVIRICNNGNVVTRKIAVR